MTVTNIAQDSPRAKTVAEVQDELIEHLVSLVPYWIKTKLDSPKDDNLTYRLSGMMHSFYVTFAGCSGGFSLGIDMYPFASEEDANERIAEGKNFFPTSADVSTDINDGSLQYHSAEDYVAIPESIGASREWDAEEMRAFLYNAVAGLLHEALEQDGLTDLGKGAYFLRSVIQMFENGHGDFPQVMLSAVPHPDDKDYYIDNDEDYYETDGTRLTGQERSLTSIWDYYWERSVAGI